MIDRAAARNILSIVIDAIREDYLLVNSELGKWRKDSTYETNYTNEQFDNYKLYKSIFVED